MIAIYHWLRDVFSRIGTGVIRPSERRWWEENQHSTERYWWFEISYRVYRCREKYPQSWMADLWQCEVTLTHLQTRSRIGRTVISAKAQDAYEQARAWATFEADLAVTQDSLIRRLKENNCLQCRYYSRHTVPPCAVNPLVAPDCKDWEAR